MLFRSKDTVEFFRAPEGVEVKSNVIGEIENLPERTKSMKIVSIKEYGKGLLAAAEAEEKEMSLMSFFDTPTAIKINSEFILVNRVFYKEIKEALTQSKTDLEIYLLSKQGWTLAPKGRVVLSKGLDLFKTGAVFVPVDVVSKEKVEAWVAECEVFRVEILKAE